MKILLGLLLLFSNNTKSMDFKQHVAPICFVTATCFAVFLIFKKMNSSTKHIDHPKDYFLEEDYPTKQNISTNIAPIRSRLKKLCKEVFLNCHDNNNYQTNSSFLSMIKKYLPTAKAEPHIRETFYETFDEGLCSIACKFGDHDFLNYILSLWPRLFDERWERYLSIASLYKQNTIFDQLKQLPLNCFIGNDCVLNRIAERQKKFLMHPENFTDEQIIKKHLKNTYYYQDYNLVANFFEAQLWQRKNNNANYPILYLIQNSLANKKHTQLLLFVIAIKNKYILLQDILQKLFGISFKSKDSNNRTLLHLAYAWPKEFAPRKLLKRLMRKNIIDINAQDNDGNTVLHSAVNAYYEGPWYNRMSSYKLGIQDLLANPLLDPNIKNKKNCTPSACMPRELLTLIDRVIQHKKFDPSVTIDGDYTSLLFETYFAIREESYRGYKYPENQGARINIGIFMNKKMMTKQLQLIPMQGGGHFGGWNSAFYWDRLDSFIQLCLKGGGSLTSPNECGLLPVDIARIEYEKEAIKEVLAYCHTNKTMRKEMTYHLLLLHTPPSITSHKVYYYLKNFCINQNIALEIGNIIMHYYYNLVHPMEIDREVAKQVKQEYDTYDTLHRPLKDLSYYRMNKKQKMNLKKEIFNRRLAITY